MALPWHYHGTTMALPCLCFVRAASNVSRILTGHGTVEVCTHVAVTAQAWRKHGVCTSLPPWSLMSMMCSPRHPEQAPRYPWFEAALSQGQRVSTYGVAPCQHASAPCTAPPALC